MSEILDTQGLQHYVNKMCNADNRKVGTKSLPIALNDIDTAIDGFKNAFEIEYGTPINMELTNNKNTFFIGTGIDIDKKDDVENSFTDIKLRGNSLVNLYSKVTPIAIQGAMTNVGDIYTITRTAESINATYLKFELNPTLFKSNTTYTVVFNNYTSSYNNSEICFYDRANSKDICRIKRNQIKNDKIGIFKFTDYHTTRLELLIYVKSQEGQYTSCSNNIVILEGDWTNKPIPQYFEGLKSVGEKQDGNHKLNISSVGKNLFDIGLLQGSWILSSNSNSFTFQGWANRAMSNYDVKQMFKPNTTYTIQSKVRMTQKIGTVAIYQYQVGGQFYHSKMIPSSFGHFRTSEIRRAGDSIVLKTTFTTPDCLDNYELRLYSNRYAEENIVQCDVIEFSEIQVEEAVTNSQFELFKADKREIVLNEPLRKISNEIKDTIEKINGKWKIIRRCAEIIVSDKSLVTYYSLNSTPNPNKENLACFYVSMPDNNKLQYGNVISDKFCYTRMAWDTAGAYNFSNHNTLNNIYFVLPKTALVSQDKNGIIKWLQTNPIKVIYELNNPIIEDIDPVALQCWKNGTIIVDEVIPIETTHTIALNKSAQIQKNIEELTSLRNRIKMLEEQYSKTALNQAYEAELLKLDMKLDDII